MPDILPSPSPVAMLESILGHLGAALMQALPSDDQIILGHVKCAEELALQLFHACSEQVDAGEMS